jgi:predicted O-methyltransferase YrrM
MYDYVINNKPKTIVELGHGSGAVTVAMAKALHDLNLYGSEIHSYDLINCNTKYNCMGLPEYATESAFDRVNNRGLSKYVKFTSGDIFETFVKTPFKFDLLLIDIDNTWDRLYNILIKNKKVNELLTSTEVIIEGGDNNHPRINNNTLSKFNKLMNQTIFSMNYLTGSGRTSISKLKI